MNIKFYYNSSDDNKLNKSLTQKLNLNGNLREGTSIITPTITIQVSDSQYLSVIESNYAYISDFKRYYFITDIVCAAKNIWDISMKVDVLMSFKYDILSLPVILDRNEYIYNKYLTDDLLPITNEREIIYTTLGGDFYSIVNTESFSETQENQLWISDKIAIGEDNIAIDFYNHNGIYVITVLANETSNLSVVNSLNVTNNSFEGTYILDANSFKEFCQRFNGISWGDFSSWFGIEKYNEYLLSIHYYPINTSKVCWWATTPIDHIPIGKDLRITLTGNNNKVYVPYFPDNIICIGSYLFEGKYKYSRYSNDFFLNLKPYSIYEVYIPYYGFYELDISRCIAEFNSDKYLFRIKYYLDYRIGKLLIKINYHILDFIEYEEIIDVVDFGYEVPVGSTNFNSTIANIMHQLTMNNLNKLVSLVGIGLGTAATGFTGNPLFIAGAAGSAINNNRTDLRASIQGSGNPSLPGRLNLLNNRQIFVKITSKVPDRPGNYNHNYGLPTHESGLLSNFNGFTKIASTHIENIRYATDNERQIIMDKLTSGILLDPPST